MPTGLFKTLLSFITLLHSKRCNAGARIMFGKTPIFCNRWRMAAEKLVDESQLAALAKQFRVKAGKKKVEAAAELGVSPPTLFLAEEDPEQSLTKLRIR